MRHTAIERGGGVEYVLQRPLQHRALFEHEIDAVLGEGVDEHSEGVARELHAVIERIAETGRIFLQGRRETLYVHTRRQAIEARPLGAILAVADTEA